MSIWLILLVFLVSSVPLRSRSFQPTSIEITESVTVRGMCGAPTTATTRELIAIHDIARTLANVLVGLLQAPRRTGPALTWAEDTLEHLYKTLDAVGAARLKCTDENQMRSVALARHLEWAFQRDEEQALLKVLDDVAARVTASTC